MAYTWDDLPASGTALFNQVMRAALNQWKTNFEASALDFAQSDHTHAGGDPVIVSICAGAANLGTGATDSEVKFTADEYGNLYTWDHDNSKWRVMDGSKYATGSLPTTARTIPTNTRVYDITLNKCLLYNGSAWIMEGPRLYAVSGNHSVTALDLYNGTIFTNTGASGEGTFTLPAGADDHRFTGIVTAAQYMKWVANGTEKFRYKADQSAAGGYVRSNTVGNMISGYWSGSEWVLSLVGVWLYDE